MFKFKFIAVLSAVAAMVIASHSLAMRQMTTREIAMEEFAMQELEKFTDVKRKKEKKKAYVSLAKAAAWGTYATLGQVARYAISSQYLQEPSLGSLYIRLNPLIAGCLALYNGWLGFKKLLYPKYTQLKTTEPIESNKTTVSEQQKIVAASDDRKSQVPIYSSVVSPNTQLIVEPTASNKTIQFEEHNIKSAESEAPKKEEQFLAICIYDHVNDINSFIDKSVRQLIDLLNQKLKGTANIKLAVDKYELVNCKTVLIFADCECSSAENCRQLTLDSIQSLNLVHDYTTPDKLLIYAKKEGNRAPHDMFEGNGKSKLGAEKIEYFMFEKNMNGTLKGAENASVIAHLVEVIKQRVRNTITAKQSANRKPQVANADFSTASSNTQPIVEPPLSNKTIQSEEPSIKTTVSEAPKKVLQFLAICLYDHGNIYEVNRDYIDQSFRQLIDRLNHKLNGKAAIKLAANAKELANCQTVLIFADCGCSRAGECWRYTLSSIQSLNYLNNNYTIPDKLLIYAKKEEEERVPHDMVEKNGKSELADKKIEHFMFEKYTSGALKDKENDDVIARLVEAIMQRIRKKYAK